VDEDDDNDDATITGGSSTTCGSCILPCLLLMLIVLSLSLAILFFLTSGHRTHSLWSPFRSNGNLTSPQPDSDEATTTASPTSTTELSINVTDSLVEGEVDIAGHNDTSNSITDSYNNGTTTFPLSEKDERLLQFFKEVLARWENVTGLEGELLIPLTMLGLFLLIVFLVSVCCCMVNRRKERRRKELFGRIITDLQTGDSKRLLTHSDQDD